MSSDQDSSKYTIIYADDDTDDLDLIGQAFAKHTDNIELITAGDGIEVLLYLVALAPQDPAPCLIILDINMPGMSGKQALAEIRSMERFRDTPVVLFTTSSHPADRDFARKYNAGFVTKPLAFREMDDIAETMVSHCQSDVLKYLSRRTV